MRIVVAPAEAYARHIAVFAMLEDVFPVRFCRFEESRGKVGAAIVITGSPNLHHRLANGDFPVYFGIETHALELFEPRQVRFVGRPPGHGFLQGHSITLKQGCRMGIASVEPSDTVIALADERPVWVERRNRCNRRVVVTGPLPTLDCTLPFGLTLIQGAFPAFIPLLDFLRELTAGIDYDTPPLQACFMFDDPNLHWPTWGHLSYPQLLRQAVEEDYHVSIATVPLDTWYTHSKAATLFRENPERLSLLVHGIKHTHAELLKPKTEKARARDLAHGLRLIERLESRHRLRVSRIMAPPIMRAAHKLVR